MDFNIKKGSSLPVLKLSVVKDGRSDYQSFMDFIETSTLFFSMVDSDTGVSKIHMEPAGFVEKTFLDPNTPVEYYIYFKFQKKHLNYAGRFEGQFTLRNEAGTLILPIREPLYINVLESQGGDVLTKKAPTSDFVILDIPENDLNSGLIIYVNDIVVLDIPENDLNYGLISYINDIVVLDIPENDLNYGLVIFINDIVVLDIPENDLNYGLVI
jgi:hypothetical protein